MNKNNFQSVLFAFGAAFFIISFCYTFILFYSFEFYDIINNLKFKNPNEIGDTIGGLLNPLFAISICVFTGLAFYAQYEANKQVQEQFKIQQFESQFYFLLNEHRKNVEDFRYKNKKGKEIKGVEVIDILYKELKDIISKVSNPNPYIAYKLFFEGGILKYNSGICHTSKIIKKEKIKSKNFLFSKYYRLLFQIVDRIDKENHIIDKEYFIRVVRASLTSNELVLLFYNWLCGNQKKNYGFMWEQRTINYNENKLTISEKKPKQNYFFTENNLLRNLFKEMLFDDYSKEVYDLLFLNNKIKMEYGNYIEFNFKELDNKIIVELDKKIIAIMDYETIADDNKFVIINVTVKKQYQNLGIATELINRIVSKTKNPLFSKIEINKNPNINSILNKYGFVEKGNKLEYESIKFL